MSDEAVWPKEDVDMLEEIIGVLQVGGRKLTHEAISQLLKGQPAQVQMRILLGLKLYGALPVSVEPLVRPDFSTRPQEDRRERRQRTHNIARDVVSRLRDKEDLWYLIDFFEGLRDLMIDTEQ